ncbi:MAG: cupredoxin family copper-binding protein [Candidatus Woesearchaeota archaeon]|nr:cupredoxin family copper-binding protein [Candidatus Woesearchaeota archaeon]
MNRKKIIGNSALFTILIVLASFCVSASRVSVSINNLAFSPAAITVNEGDSVIWTNNDNAPHTITADNNAFESGTKQHGQTFSHTFDHAGTFAYHCTIHPGMAGRVVVQAPPTAPESDPVPETGGAPPNEQTAGQEPAQPDANSQNALNDFLRGLLGGLREQQAGSAEASTPEASTTQSAGAGLQAVIQIKESFTPLPKIVVAFDEPVSLMTGRIFFVQEKTPEFENFTEEAIPPGGFIDIIDGIPSREIRERWRLEPSHALPPGFYVVEIHAKDMVGNEATFRQFFAVDYETMKIQVTRPRLGASRERNVTVEVSTFKNDAPLNTMCKYSQRDPKFRFLLQGMVSSNMFGPTHAFPTLSREPFIDLTPNRRGNNFFLICQTPEGEIGQTKAEIYVDTEPPTIRKAAFDPNLLVEIPDDHHFFSDLVVEANEDVQCKYALQGGLPFDSMSPFDGYAREEFGSYKTINHQKIELPEPETKLSKVFFVRCEDRTGQLSQEVPAGVTIDLTEPIHIEISSPKSESNSNIATLNFTTNKISRCYYTLENQTAFLEDERNPGKTHSADLGTLADGRYTMQVTCESSTAGTQQRSVKEHLFLIDTSPPNAPSFNGSTTSCTPERFDLDLAVTATDTQSSIRMFRYFVAETEKNGTFGGRDGTGKLPSIEAKAPASETNTDDTGGSSGKVPAFTHTIIISAVNNVGLEGPASPLILNYDPQHPDCLEHDPPEVVLQKKSSPGTVEVTPVCDDESGCDDTTFLFGLGGENLLGATNTTIGTGSAETCTPSNHVDAAQPVSVHRTREMCWEVADTLGNKASGRERIVVTVPQTCSNSIKDGDETGTDCGGSCGNTCGEGDSCQTDFDCLGEYCLEGRCVPPKCDDVRKNGDETDSDCGGLVCSRCDLNKACGFDNDCISSYCDVKTTKTCQLPTCADNAANGNESDVDCGTACPNKCKPGRACASADDCTSGICNLGRCGVLPGGTQEKKTEQAQPSAVWAFVKSNILFIIGILLIGGGAGFLASTSPTLVPKPALIAPFKPISSGDTEQKKAVEAAQRVQETGLARRRQRVETRERERGTVIDRFTKKTGVFQSKGKTGQPVTFLRPMHAAHAAAHLVRTAAKAGTQLAGKVVEQLPDAVSEWLPLTALQRKQEHEPARPRVVPGKMFPPQNQAPAQQKNAKAEEHERAAQKSDDDLFDELERL